MGAIENRWKNLKARFTPKLLELVQQDVDAEIKKFKTYHEVENVDQKDLDAVELKILKEWQKKSYEDLKTLDPAYGQSLSGSERLRPKAVEEIQSTEKPKPKPKPTVKEVGEKPTAKPKRKPEPVRKQGAKPDLSKQKEALEKRNKEAETEYEFLCTYENFVDAIQHDYEQAELRATAEYDIDDIKESDPEEAERRLKIARSKEAKRFRSMLNRVSEFHELKFKEDLKGKDQWFPTGWMERNKKISETIKKYPLLCPIMNFIREYTKDGTDILVDENYQDEYQYSTFIPDADFYGAITKELDVSEKTVRRYLYGLIRINAIKILKKGPRNQRILADGYYRRYQGNRTKKESFLVESPEFRKALAEFQP